VGRGGGHKFPGFSSDKRYFLLIYRHVHGSAVRCQYYLDRTTVCTMHSAYTAQQPFPPPPHHFPGLCLYTSLCISRISFNVGSDGTYCSVVILTVRTYN